MVDVHVKKVSKSKDQAAPQDEVEQDFIGMFLLPLRLIPQKGVVLADIVALTVVEVAPVLALL